MEKEEDKVSPTKVLGIAFMWREREKLARPVNIFFSIFFPALNNESFWEVVISFFGKKKKERLPMHLSVSKSDQKTVYNSWKNTHTEERMIAAVIFPFYGRWQSVFLNRFGGLFSNGVSQLWPVPS